MNDLKPQMVLCNVYQYSYKNEKTNGLGDFIRGCLFLINFCEKHNYRFNIIINHPLATFLKLHCELYTFITEKVEKSENFMILC